MRELVIRLILIHKDQHRGFPPASTRWNGGTKRIPVSRFRVNGVHFSEVDWNSLTDMELLCALETIIAQGSKQM